MPRPSPWIASLTVLGAAVFGTAATAAEGVDLLLIDVTREVGVDFVHQNGMTGQLYFPEMTGQGGAVFDADGDGDLDLLALQGQVLDPDASRTVAKGAHHRFFRNRLVETGTLTFVDATQDSGLGVETYGMGAATGDIDRDGDLDVFVTAWGADRLFRNDGEGRFVDVSDEALPGLGDSWSTSAAFVDIDGDGWLDLFVARYVAWDLERNPTCYATSSRRDYCGPSAFTGVADLLLRNRGDGTFEDVTRSAGIATSPGPGLGVVTGDFDGDGRVDVYVANDGKSNVLWSFHEGRATDLALLAGLAVNREGSPEASMGVALGDLDNDGDEDLFVAHLAGETDTLYENRGDGIWEDRTRELGLGPPSLGSTSFGVAWLDVDQDGWLDLAIADGAVRIQEDRLRAGDSYPLGQPNRLLRNLGGDDFVDFSDRIDASYRQIEVGRGLAAADLDNDGAADLVVFLNNGPLRIYRGRSPVKPWLGVEVRDDVGGPALGAEVVLTTDQGTMFRRVRTDGSYCTASDPRALFALGGRRATLLEIRWPDGRTQRVEGPKTGSYLRIEPQGVD